jgi:hypothetical protein
MIIITTDPSTTDGPFGTYTDTCEAEYHPEGLCYCRRCQCEMVIGYASAYAIMIKDNDLYRRLAHSEVADAPVGQPLTCFGATPCNSPDGCEC